MCLRTFGLSGGGRLVLFSLSLCRKVLIIAFVVVADGTGVGGCGQSACREVEVLSC